MAKKVFVSFDYEHDKHYKFLLEAWSKNDKFDFEFYDHSSGEINTNDISRVKAALTAKIRSADITFVIIGKYANSWHEDYEKIGYKNWINFEIAKSVEAGNSLVAIKLDREFVSPDEILNKNASWAYSFTEDSIVAALEKAQ